MNWNGFIIIGLLACALTACASYDYEKSELDQKADSCREDPYQDMCQPGYMEP